MDREKIESTKRRIEIHKKYIESLERTSNVLKKNLIAVNKVQEIKDDIDFYIETSEQGDFSEGQDSMEIFEEILEKYDSTCKFIDIINAHLQYMYMNRLICIKYTK